MVYIGESRHGVSLESMFTWEVAYKFPFQECGTAFLEPRCSYGIGTIVFPGLMHSI